MLDPDYIEDIRRKAKAIEEALGACTQAELSLILHNFTHEGLISLLEKISCALTCQHNKQQDEVKH